METNQIQRKAVIEKNNFIPKAQSTNVMNNKALITVGNTNPIYNLEYNLLCILLHLFLKKDNKILEITMGLNLIFLEIIIIKVKYIELKKSLE